MVSSAGLSAALQSRRPAEFDEQNSARPFFSNGKIWGILVLYRSRCVAKTQNVWWPNIGSRGWCLLVLQVLPSGLRVTQRNLCDDICSVMNFVILVHSCLHLQFPCMFATTSLHYLMFNLSVMWKTSNIAPSGRMKKTNKTMSQKNR